RHVHGVYGAARRQCAQEADDITQAVFLLLWQRAPHLRVDGGLAGWLHRATRYCCANARRSLARRRRHEREAAMRRTSEATDASSTGDLLPALDAAVASLPARYREAVLLRYLRSEERRVGKGRSPRCASQYA